MQKIVDPFDSRLATEVRPHCPAQLLKKSEMLSNPTSAHTCRAVLVPNCAGQHRSSKNSEFSRSMKMGRTATARYQTSHLLLSVVIKQREHHAYLVNDVFFRAQPVVRYNRPIIGALPSIGKKYGNLYLYSLSTKRNGQQYTGRNSGTNYACNIRPHGMH